MHAALSGCHLYLGIQEPGLWSSSRLRIMMPGLGMLEVASLKISCYALVDNLRTNTVLHPHHELW